MVTSNGDGSPMRNGNLKNADSGGARSMSASFYGPNENDASVELSGGGHEKDDCREVPAIPTQRTQDEAEEDSGRGSVSTSVNFKPRYFKMFHENYIQRSIHEQSLESWHSYIFSALSRSCS